MKRLILLILFILTVSQNSKAQISNSKENRNPIIELEIGFQEYQKDYIINKIRELNLPEFSVDIKNDSTLKIYFNSIIKDTNLDYVKENSNISFLKTYETNILVHPTVQFFWDNGAKKIVLGDSFIAKFAIKDTSHINNSLKQEIYRSTLPQDLFFTWCNAEYYNATKDSVELHIIKKSNLENSPDQNNLIELSTEIITTDIPVESDEKGMPTKWEKQNNYVINFKLDTIGSNQFHHLTKELQSKRLAFSVNDKIVAIPKLIIEIDNGEISISSLNKKLFIEFYEQLLFSEYDRQQVYIKGINYKG